MKCLVAKKIGMTTIYSEGKADNVTLLEAFPNEILAVRTLEKDGYKAIQVCLPKQERGDGKSDGSKKGRKSKYDYVCEFRIENGIEGFEKGRSLTVEQFQKDEKVLLQGVTKGKGYQGVVKRHGFKGSPASHGHRHDLRAPGSIGSAFPERVFKGKKMAGRMGNAKKTVENLKVVLVDSEKKLLALKGAVPGQNGSFVRVYAE